MLKSRHSNTCNILAAFTTKSRLNDLEHIDQCKKNNTQNVFSFLLSFLPNQKELEQLECLPSENTPAAPWLPIILVIHIRSQVKTKSKLQIKKKIAKNSNFEILQGTLHVTHFLKSLDMMYYAVN